MATAEKTPVLVGVGQVLQRLDDPREADEPLELMVRALTRAGEDSGVPKLLERAGSIYVPRGAWSYGDPGRVVAERLGASPGETVGTPYGGNYSQGCVLDAARAIAAGRLDVALVCGAENGRSASQARRQGLELPTRDAPGTPSRAVDEDKPIFHPAELARGMNSASDVFAIIESAIRADSGASPADHARRITALWAGMSRVAADNPNAWIREPRSAEEIGRAGPDNPMISTPYTRLLNANARVDMGAGLVLCSLATARAVGVPEAKCIFPLAGSEANDSLYLSERRLFHRSPAIAAAGPLALELAGRSAASIEHVDLYSCFPSSVEVAARELGLSEERPLSLTGGLTFGGGPLNCYGLHAVARAVEVLREDRGAAALVHGNGGWLAKHSFGVYAAEPHIKGFRYARPQELVDAEPRREALVDFEGPVVVEAYTVAHTGGVPRRALAACLTDDGRRSWGALEDPALLEQMGAEEFCGRRGRLDGQGQLQLD